MPVFNSFGAAFGPTFGPTAEQRRAKADAEATQVRRDALPASVATWAAHLSFAEQEALAVVQRLYIANGSSPVAIPRADLAAHLGCTPEAADALLNGLAKAGAISRNLRLQAAPRYIPVAAPPAPRRSTKSAIPTVRSDDTEGTPRLRAGLGLRPL
jgi:hypothetical protein